MRLFLFLLSLSTALSAADFAVTTTADSGAGSLREALLSIGPGDTITCDAALTGTISLQSSLPAITIDTVITGPTSGSVTIDGAGLYSIFSVGSNTTMSNFILANSDPAIAGSAILVGTGAILALESVTIPHCMGGSCTGALLVADQGYLTTHNLAVSSSNGAGLDLLIQDSGGAQLVYDPGVQSTLWIDCTSSLGIPTLYVSGGGTLTLNTMASSMDVNLVADNGTLIFSGSCLEPIYTNPNGTLQGTPTAPYLSNGGTLQVGSSFGMLSNTSDFFQTNQGTLILKIDPSGISDTVQIPGAAYLAGTLIIQLQSGSYSSGTSYPLLNYGGFTRPFDQVFFRLPNQSLEAVSNASLNYGASSLSLTFTSNVSVPP